MFQCYAIVHFLVEVSIVSETLVVFFDGLSEKFDVAVDLCEHGLDILLFLVLELELFGFLGEVLVEFVQLREVLDVEGEVLGPCEQCGVGLARFVVGLGAVGKCLLHFTQDFFVFVKDISVCFKGDL